ncbi:MAG: NAD(P)H-dependent oxidoreductase [Clostridiales bacterium]|nr:NAD(P)H-dependent oxidoreductase [Clostridiales bacterium]
MMKIKLIKKRKLSEKMEKVIEAIDKNIIDMSLDIEGNYKNSKILFFLEADEIGMDFEVMTFLHELYLIDKESFKGSYIAMVVYSSGVLYTKKIAKEIAFIGNNMGATVIGKPLIEALGDLDNLNKWSNKLGLTKDETFVKLIEKLIQRLQKYEKKHIDNPKLLVLHANSNPDISNTHIFWREVSKNLKIEYQEIHVEDGTVLDCRGCSYKTCKYYAQQDSCFYGGIMVKEILPAIKNADAILWLIPNYNDAISAKLMAVINRLTVLYRRHSLIEKNIFAIVVSGNSGSDSPLRQLIGALTINKGFRLPPNFSINANANDAGEILKIDNFEKIAEEFARHINEESHWI